MKRNIIILFVTIGMSFTANAQKGNIKIFSEIKDVNIYLDEIFQGTDIISIDSVMNGSHYLKALKDSVIIYSELITIQANTTTTVLIKNSSQIKEKLLESKTNEIQEYKSKKLDVILSKNYVTETKSKGSSYYFPGYYVVTGTSSDNSVSTTSSYTDWKIIQGGNKVISEITFAKLTGDTEIEDSYNNENDIFQKKLKKYNKKMNRSLAIGIPSIIVTGIIAADLLGSKSFLNLSSTTEAIIATAGILGSVIGIGATKSNPPTLYQGHYTTVEHASNKAFEYNQSLKKQLGLPENFEPEK